MLFVAGSLLVAAICGCEVKSAPLNKPAPLTFNMPCDNCGESHDIKYKVVCVNGCEYIATGKFFAHKGDCKNPMHPQQYEKQEILIKTNRICFTNDVILKSTNIVWQQVDRVNFIVKIAAAPTTILFDFSQAGESNQFAKVEFDTNHDGRFWFKENTWVNK